jgi:hypothetical protein
MRQFNSRVGGGVATHSIVRRVSSNDWPARCCCECTVEGDLRIRPAIRAGEAAANIKSAPGRHYERAGTQRGLHRDARSFSSQIAMDAPCESQGIRPMRKTAVSPLPFAFRCFPPASPTFATRAGKQKTAPKDRSNRLISLRKSGAGEGIRTLDPNLGKVVLYP